MERYPPHKYLWLGGLLLFIFFIIYVFWYDHKEGIQNAELADQFRKVGIDPRDMTHDEVWYYKRRSTCVGYGDQDEECPKHISHCAGKKTFGSSRLQAEAVSTALKHGGQHPDCPLVYVGAD